MQGEHECEHQDEPRNEHRKPSGSAGVEIDAHGFHSPEAAARGQWKALAALEVVFPAPQISGTAGRTQGTTGEVICDGDARSLEIDPILDD